MSGRRQAYVHKHQTNVHAKITQEHLHDLKGFMKPILPGKEHRIETLSYFLNTITSNWYNMAPASLLLTGLHFTATVYTLILSLQSCPRGHLHACLKPMTKMGFVWSLFKSLFTEIECFPLFPSCEVWSCLTPAQHPRDFFRKEPDILSLLRGEPNFSQLSF